MYANTYFFNWQIFSFSHCGSNFCGKTLLDRFFIFRWGLFNDLIIIFLKLSIFSFFFADQIRWESTENEKRHVPKKISKKNLFSVEIFFFQLPIFFCGSGFRRIDDERGETLWAEWIYKPSAESAETTLSFLYSGRSGSDCESGSALKGEIHSRERIYCSSRARTRAGQYDSASSSASSSSLGCLRRRRTRTDGIFGQTREPVRRLFGARLHSERRIAFSRWQQKFGDCADRGNGSRSIINRRQSIIHVYFFKSKFDQKKSNLIKINFSEHINYRRLIIEREPYPDMSQICLCNVGRLVFGWQVSPESFRAKNSWSLEPKVLFINFRTIYLIVVKNILSHYLANLSFAQTYFTLPNK